MIGAPNMYYMAFSYIEYTRIPHMTIFNATYGQNKTTRFA